MEKTPIPPIPADLMEKASTVVVAITTDLENSWAISAMACSSMDAPYASSSKKGVLQLLGQRMGSSKGRRINFFKKK
jgi:hypothetical protein